jgi:hypothetical protein
MRISLKTVLCLVSFTPALVLGNDLPCKGTPDETRGAYNAGVFAVQESTGGKLVYTVDKLKKQFGIKSLNDFAVVFIPSEPNGTLENLTVTIMAGNYEVYRTEPAFKACPKNISGLPDSYVLSKDAILKASQEYKPGNTVLVTGNFKGTLKITRRTPEQAKVPIKGAYLPWSRRFRPLLT